MNFVPGFSPLPARSWISPPLIPLFSPLTFPPPPSLPPLHTPAPSPPRPPPARGGARRPPTVSGRAGRPSPRAGGGSPPVFGILLGLPEGPRGEGAGRDHRHPPHDRKAQQPAAGKPGGGRAEPHQRHE